MSSEPLPLYAAYVEILMFVDNATTCVLIDAARSVQTRPQPAGSVCRVLEIPSSGGV